MVFDDGRQESFAGSEGQEQRSRSHQSVAPAFRQRHADVEGGAEAEAVGVGEATAIMAENFDAANGTMRLRQYKTAHKGKSRVLYLPPEITALLSKLAKRYPQGPLLRTCWGNAWEKSKLVRDMISLRKRAGVPHATLYGFRHSFATQALASGVPDAQVAALLGHSGTAMLHKHYSHLGARAQVLREALSKVR
jgi:integrase